MSSTLMPAVAAGLPVLRNALVLPAATEAPKALVIAVEMSAAQDTSALCQERAVLSLVAAAPAARVPGGNADGAGAYAAPVTAGFRTRAHAVQGPPSRGTPV